MSLTPRTDAFLAQHPDGFGIAPFTRELERELAAAEQSASVNYERAQELERERNAATNALSDAIDDKARLLAALKGLNAMYTHCWDLVDGGLAIMPPSVPKFEAANFAAVVAIAKSEGKTECICFWDDDRIPSVAEEATRICDDCGLKIIV